MVSSDSSSSSSSDSVDNQTDRHELKRSSEISEIEYKFLRFQSEVRIQIFQMQNGSMHQIEKEIWEKQLKRAKEKHVCLKCIRLTLILWVVLTIGWLLFYISVTRKENEKDMFNEQIIKTECQMIYDDPIILTVCIDEVCCNNSYYDYAHYAHYTSLTDNRVECYYNIDAVCGTVSLLKPLFQETDSNWLMRIFGILIMVITVFYSKFHLLSRSGRILMFCNGWDVYVLTSILGLIVGAFLINIF